MWGGYDLEVVTAWYLVTAPATALGLLVVAGPYFVVGVFSLGPTKPQQFDSPLIK